MGQSFDDYSGFHPFRSWANTYAQDCTYLSYYRFHRAAFIFIANMAVTDLFVFFCVIMEVVVEKVKNAKLNADFKSVDKMDSHMNRFRILDQQIVSSCR